MEHLIECVPNFSTSDETGTPDLIEGAIDSTPGTLLLDRTSDVDHARSVFTVAGAPAPTVAAMEQAVHIAIEHIDMRSHVGKHPRLGAIDVVPFVPLGATDMTACVDMARSFAASIAERYDIPIYLYAGAAERRDRAGLAELRRPGFEGLAEAMARPGGEPDYGPRRPHPTAGAIAVGARPFLIAWNIQLSSSDVAVARRIAGLVRERDGGLPRVQALGIELPSQGCVQVSMNLLDYTTTPLWHVFETVSRHAAEQGVDVLDAELIGLAPLGAFTQVAEHIGVGSEATAQERVDAAARWLRIRDHETDMALELRLERLWSGTTSPLSG